MEMIMSSIKSPFWALMASSAAFWTGCLPVTALALLVECAFKIDDSALIPLHVAARAF